LGPLGVKLELLAAFLRSRDRDEVAADASSLNNFVGYPVVGELEMSGRLGESRIDDRVLNDDLVHR